MSKLSMSSKFVALMAVGLAAVAYAAPAWADGELSARDIESAVDEYLQTDDDVSLVGGPGTAGYDRGFWIRGGDFMLRMNATLQARFEAMDWDDVESAGGDLSGFSLPRATLKFSLEAPCNLRAYMELDFGHFGRDVAPQTLIPVNPALQPLNLGPTHQSDNFDNTREAWIEWGKCDAFNIRMGQIGLPTTRQLMVAPELQQFVDISLYSSFVGLNLPGYTDRNRDHGIMIHGAFGCNTEFSYMFAVTNGDGGDSIRNVIDTRTSDNLAFSGRLNWAFLKPIGYQEGALSQETCGWYGEVGAWGFYYADRVDNPHEGQGDYLRWGVDLALGYGGFSFTSAYSSINDSDVPTVPASAVTLDDDSTAFLVQMGYHFPGTAWEVAARYSSYDTDGDILGDGSATELAFGINYYLNFHGAKFQADVALIDVEDQGFLIFDRYPGYGGLVANEDSATLLRFQWQLAL